jgi:hypothetical protein
MLRTAGQPRSLLAGLNSSDGAATSFNPDAAGGVTVYALTVASERNALRWGIFPQFALGYQQSSLRSRPKCRTIYSITASMFPQPGD